MQVESLTSMKIPCGLAAVLDAYLSEYFLLPEANTQSSLLKHSINAVRENEVPLDPLMTVGTRVVHRRESQLSELILWMQGEKVAGMRLLYSTERQLSLASTSEDPTLWLCPIVVQAPMACEPSSF